jgi:hypothetical protein
LALTTTTSSQQSAKPTPSRTGMAQGALWKDIADKVDPKARYLFYLHGRIIEEQGIRPTSPRFGVYEYEKILQTLVDKGFVVISEARPKGTDMAEYANKVVGQIQTLLKVGVPPERITVVGASKGGGIAILTSTLLKNRNVNFVIIAACAGDPDAYQPRVDFWGNILSIYDYKDDTGAESCQKFFAQSTGLNRRKEVVLKFGLGHGILYRPLKEWVDPAVAWAKQR